MAIYSDTCDKTLSKAVPTVDANGLVKSWDLEVVYSYPAASDTGNTDTPLRRRYEEKEDVAYLAKAPEAFTKSELFSFLNIGQYNLVFDSTYISLNFPPEETVVNDFDFSALSD